jgi:ComF family protein
MPRRGLTAVADAVVATLFAPSCLSCGDVLEHPTECPVCPACWRRLPRFTGGGGGHALPSLSLVATLGPFDGVLRDVVHGLKFQGRRSLAARIGPLLRQAAAPALHGADAVVPVPLHPWREWRRGYNQSALLAATLGLPVWPLLRRVHATVPQSTLDARARYQNVRDAFALGSRWPGSAARAAARIDGRVLVLVDDVLTTGATLDACGRVLRQAGAGDVRAITAARAELRG